MDRLVLSLLVENKPGVLNRVAGLFSRRGYNIESISVGQTNIKGMSRMTVVSTGDEQILTQIEKQLGKLVEVVEIEKLEPDDSVYRELVLIKVDANADQRTNINSIVDIFRAHIIDVSPTSLIIEVTGNTRKVNQLLTMTFTPDSFKFNACACPCDPYPMMATVFPSNNDKSQSDS